MTGCWPAAWFQGVGHTNGSYPSDYSEFDLQESGLPDVQSTGCTAWGPGASGQQNMSAALTGSSHTTIDTNFHVYRMDYLATEIQAYIDGALVYTITQAAVDAHYGAVSGLNAAYGGQEWPYAANNGMWIILNVAVNSSDTGSTPADASLPATIMTVDYVRVWSPAGPDPNTGSSAATATPAVLAGTVAFPAAGIRTGETVTTAVLTAAVSFPAVTVSAGTAAAPPVLAATAAFPAAVLHAGAQAQPPVLAGAAALSVPAVRADETLTTTVLAATTVFPAPVITTITSTIVPPPVLAATAGFPVASPQTGETAEIGRASCRERV